MNKKKDEKYEKNECRDAVSNWEKFVHSIFYNCDCSIAKGCLFHIPLFN